MIFSTEETTITTAADSLSRPAMAGAGLVLADFYQSLLPYILTALVLIVVDTRFGIKAAKKRGEEVRPSRCWRRMLNKLVDYLCWVVLSGLFGQSFGRVLGIPIVSALMLLIVYGIEITSCFNNYFEYRGIGKRIDFFRLIGKDDVGRAIKDKEEKK